MTAPAGRVRLAVTMGDPAGIGPEVAARALAGLSGVALAGIEITLVGERRVFAAAGMPERFLERLRATGVFDPAREPTGAPSAASGSASFLALEAAIEMACEGTVDGVVTAPLSKRALHLAGQRYPGQTEILIARSRARAGEMVFVGGGLLVALATRHLPLRDVARSLDADRLETVLLLLDRALAQDFAGRGRRIAVAGVNPHAGEEGLFGTEEADLLIPVLERLRGRGLDLAGPLPADTAFVRARNGEFDAVVAMYHDQGLIPVKLLAFGAGVNVTIGLPFVRTSPDHGTAYDIAGKGVADPSSMRQAILLAAEMARTRRRSLRSSPADG